MPTKPRTKKPAAKPLRKPRKTHVAPTTAEDIGLNELLDRLEI
ncbi:hypothetical protein [Tabrizicola sp.]